ncbi:MAG: hypothetical protein NTW21_43155 [Verrucomicrobia bacterium]|nr:hypothetical protein [Verrucomicrobiota bacterium]
MDWIENWDSQVHGMLGGPAKKLVIRGKHGIHLQGFGGGEVERVKALEAQAVQFHATLLNHGRQGLERRGVAEEVQDTMAAGLINDAVEFKLKHTAVSKLDLPHRHPLQDSEHGRSFQLDAGLRLIVVWTIQAAGVEVEQHVW